MTPPTKPKTDNFRRVVRGGSWYDSSASVVRAACRGGDTPSGRRGDVGFRCAQRGCRQSVDRA